MAEQEMTQIEEQTSSLEEDEVGSKQSSESTTKKLDMNFKLFDLYDVSDIKLNDIGMKKYFNLEPKLVIKSQGKIREKFSRAKLNLLEIFANTIGIAGHRGKKHKIMTGHRTGKYSKNMMVILNCLKIIEEKTKQNPVQVLVTAIENAAPRDGVTIIEYGGARYPQAVDISPLRRVTATLKMIIWGSYDKSFNKKTRIESALADEIIKAYNREPDSYAMAKKNDSERQADSAR